MATLSTPRASAGLTQSRPRDDPMRPSKRNKKDTSRPEIWSNLLRQTREAQARSRTQALQTRHLILCGGTPADQGDFTSQYVARPPPPAGPTSRAQTREQRERRPRGEVRLSNTFALGYGHVTLFSPPQGGSGGAGLLGGEAEEVARVEVHTVPEAEGAYVEALRRILEIKKGEVGDEGEDVVGEESQGLGAGEEKEERRPAVCILLSWRQPWTFLQKLRRWFQLIARALLPEGAPMDEQPMDVLQEFKVNVTVVLQHTEAQEALERENYKEESFDYTSQCMRTCLLPLSAALVYTPSSAPPQQPGSPLSEAQKVVYNSLGLDVGALQTKVSGGSKREDLQPRHNVVDRMAIVVPGGWDSVGKVRLLSENFSPEAILEGWATDLSIPLIGLKPKQAVEVDEPQEEITESSPTQANGGAEVFEPQPSSPVEPLPDDTPTSPSKMPKSAVNFYEQEIQDPNAHKAPKPPQIEVTTKADQAFLGEMRHQLQHFEKQDTERQRSNPNMISTTAGSLTGGRINAPAGEQTGALSDLGDVSFNVGGVSYNTVSAEAAIERLKRPAQSQPGQQQPGSESSTPRTNTPRPPRRTEGSESAGRTDTPTSAKSDNKVDNMPIDKLEEYFHSLMKGGGGGGGGSGGGSSSSREGTPSRGP